MDLREVLRRPIVTEKSTLLQEKQKYVFEVAPDANKVQVREAVELVFDVNVLDVNIIKVRPKPKRRGQHAYMTRMWKKAVVTLSQGSKIELFEGA
ncbi:MAG: large subunit ribosomal protein L23 [Chloroflexi bacterium]|nr:MAG: large subunit ribosomal protein L23 [Chloroflexota bacterium]